MADSIADVSAGDHINYENEDKVQDELGLLFKELDLTAEDLLLDDLDDYIQENLEDELVKDAFTRSTDIRTYAHQIEESLINVENESVKDYLAEASNIANLHSQIGKCDDILQRMEVILERFQSDLGSISSEIQTLQSQSLNMNVRLKNRQSVRGELSQFVDEIAVPDIMISSILDSPASDRPFLEQLHELNHKINFVKEQDFKEATSTRDVVDVLRQLKAKAVVKIREFLLNKIQTFKKPLSNYQIPQNAMLKVRFYYEFLLCHERSVAKEIRDEYVDTVSKVYLSYFKSYHSKLMRLLHEDLADKHDLLASEESNVKRGFFSSASSTSYKNKAGIFSLNGRDIVLSSELEAPVIVPHAAPTNTKFFYEQIFRSFQLAFLDNACREYFFLCDFFLATGQGASDLFNQVLGKTATSLLRNVERYISSCYDTLSCLICLQVVRRYQVAVHRRQVPSLEKYYQSLASCLWTRFHFMCEQHTRSLAQCDPSNAPSDTRPHTVTRRYSELVTAILIINDASFRDDRVGGLLAQLQTAFEGFLTKISNGFKVRSDAHIFFINNMDLVHSLLTQRISEECREMEQTVSALNDRRQQYIDEALLLPHFGELVRLSQESSSLADRSELFPNHQEKRIVAFVTTFNGEWRRQMETMSSSCMAAFSNFKCGALILQAALTQLIQHYHQVQKMLIQTPWFKQHPVKSNLVNIHNIMVEAKKFKQTY